MNRAIEALNVRLDELRQSRRGMEEELNRANEAAAKARKSIDEIDATAKEILRAVETLRRPPVEAPKPQPAPSEAKAEPVVEKSPPPEKAPEQPSRDDPAKPQTSARQGAAKK